MFRARALSVIIALLLSTAACGGDPPDKEMQQAQGAIDAARAAGADQYAHEEFTAAQDALKHANQAVDQRDYRLALNHALDSRERAQNAAKLAADGKASARVDADRAMTSATAALVAAQVKLRAFESSKAPTRTLLSLRRAIADAERHVQEARAAFDRSDYAAATSTASKVPASLTDVTRDLDTPPSTPARRRR
jgi:hypothetical protein